MWNAIFARLGSVERHVFLKAQLLRTAKIFFGLLFLFLWLFDASGLGATIWAVFFALFVGGGAAYLSWDDPLPDHVILARLNRVSGIAVSGTADMAVAGEPE